MFFVLRKFFTFFFHVKKYKCFLFHLEKFFHFVRAGDVVTCVYSDGMRAVCEIQSPRSRMPRGDDDDVYTRYMRWEANALNGLVRATTNGTDWVSASGCKCLGQHHPLEPSTVDSPVCDSVQRVSCGLRENASQTVAQPPAYLLCVWHICVLYIERLWDEHSSGIFHCKFIHLSNEMRVSVKPRWNQGETLTE